MSTKLQEAVRLLREVLDSSRNETAHFGVTAVDEELIAKFLDSLTYDAKFFVIDFEVGPRKTAAGPWIPVTERLPDHQGWVLLVDRLGSYNDGWWGTNGVRIKDRDVTHWAEITPP